MQTRQVAAYYRRSTDMQETSIEDQQASVREFAKRNCMEIIREFIADAITGRYLDDNWVFQEMVEYCTSGDVQLLLTYDESRFSRADPDETAHYRYLLKKNGVSVIYVTNPTVDPLITSVKDHMAYRYSLDLARLVRERCKRHAIAGRFNGGRAPYGYVRLLLDEQGNPIRKLAPGEQKQLKTGRVVLTLDDTNKVEIVRRIFNLYVSDKGIRAIVGILNRENIPAPRGGAWNVSTVFEILRNPVYTGCIVWNRHCYSHRSPKGKRGKRKNIEREWAIKEDAHPAIISQELWAKAQRQHKGSYQEATTRKQNAYLLSGRVLCNYCGTNYWGHYRRAKKLIYRYYICGGHFTRGDSYCPGLSIRAEILEDFALDKLQEIINLPVVREEIQKRICQKIAELNQQEKKAQDNQRLLEIRRQIKALLEVIKTGDFDSMSIREEIGRLELEEKKLLLAKRQGLIDKSRIDFDKMELEISRHLDNIRGLLDCGTSEERQNCIRQFLDHITVDPILKEATFYFYSPAEALEVAGCGGRI